MPSVLWTLVPQSMAPAPAASPGTSQNVSPTADLLNLNLHLNKIPGKSTCSLQFEKHSFIALFRVYLYPPTYSLSSITPSQMKIQFSVYIIAAFYSVAPDRKGAFPIRLYYLRNCILSKVTPGTVACQAPPWNFPGKNTGVGPPWKDIFTAMFTPVLFTRAKARKHLSVHHQMNG